MKFVHWWSALTLGAGLAAAASSASAAELPSGVAAGDVTASSAVLWARAEVPGRIRFEVSTDSDFSQIRARYAELVTDPVRPANVRAATLLPNHRYYYRATDAAGNRSVGTFKTAAVSAAVQGLRFGVTGDWRGELAPYPAVRNVPDRALDFLVILGDSIYADFPSPALPQPQARSLADYRTKHRETLTERFGLNTWAAARASTAVYATIDDHEVINDFAGGAAPSSDPRFDATGRFINETELYRNGIQAFHEYLPIAAERYGATGDPRTAFKPRLYRARNFGRDAAIFVLDARSFRDQELPDATSLTDPTAIGTFLASTFTPGRTLLGAQQISDLQRDLLRAQQAGITWKFIMVPEPIQNLGILGAPDRFEGYAAERTALLKFIDQNNINNVVFVTADIHGTLVNNLAYQLGPLQPSVPVAAWEISTGSVAFAAPFGPTVAELGAAAGLISPAQLGFYQTLPVAPDPDDLPNDADDFIKSVVNDGLAQLGYDLIGLANSGIDAELLQGDYLVTHAFGWTEFEIDPDSQALLVTTYGVPHYNENTLATAPATVANAAPDVISQFRVRPQP